jgi:superfamily II DNA/RNA helicase
LAPTRELADQITTALRPLAAVVDRRIAAVYGGVGYGPQIGALRKGVDILVATPGRLEDLIAQGSVDLAHVDIVVIDEADRMADMGFLPVVRRILDRTAATRQTLLFSATLDGDIAVLSRDYQRDPVAFEAGNVETIDVAEATHLFWLVDQHDRLQHTANVINATGRSIVFTRTRHGADRLARQLAKEGVEAVAMHGGRSQSQRTRALKEFSAGRVSALIATDVAARGIHVDDVATVIHYDLPTDHKDYLHRSGRTARAGARGTVVSLVTSDKERSVRRMQRDLNLTGSIRTPRVEDLSGDGGALAGPMSGNPERRTRVERPETVSIYVGNLPWKATHRDLESLFARHGRVHSANVVNDRKSGRSRGYGFVDMSHSDGARAIDTLQGHSMGGRQLKVRLARP